MSVIAADYPGGGFEGASAQTFDWMAGEIFDAIYGEGAFKGRSIVKFSGGLVDSTPVRICLTLRSRVQDVEGRFPPD